MGTASTSEPGDRPTQTQPSIKGAPGVHCKLAIAAGSVLAVPTTTTLGGVAGDAARWEDRICCAIDIGAAFPRHGACQPWLSAVGRPGISSRPVSETRWQDVPTSRTQGEQSGYAPGVIARVQGTLLSAQEGAVEVEPTGLGAIALTVLVPIYLHDVLRPKVGEVITLHTICTLEGVSQGTSFTPRLIGFESAADRAFFELFTTVKGVGNRKALRALARPPASVALAIKSADTESLQTLPEIGKRTAETIVHELKRKVEPHLIALAGVPTDDGDGMTGQVTPIAEIDLGHPLGAAATEAVGALVALGETQHDATKLVSAAIKECGEDGSPDEILAAAFGKRQH